jgi:hypothetical protein
MKARALTELALSLGFSVYEVIRKLHNLRCQYTSELKKTRVSKPGQGASERCESQWPYFDVFRCIFGVQIHPQQQYELKFYIFRLRVLR